MIKKFGFLLSVLVVTSCVTLPLPSFIRTSNPQKGTVEQSEPVAIFYVMADIPYKKLIGYYSYNPPTYSGFYWNVNYEYDFSELKKTCEYELGSYGYTVFVDDPEVYSGQFSSLARYQIGAKVTQLELYHAYSGAKNDPFAEILVTWFVFDSFSETVVYEQTHKGVFSIELGKSSVLLVSGAFKDSLFRLIKDADFQKAVSASVKTNDTKKKE